jgi:hypothetical protein
MKLLPHKEHRRLNYKYWPFNIIQSLIIVRSTRNTYIHRPTVCGHSTVAATCVVSFSTEHSARDYVRHVFSIITTIYSDYFPKQRRQFTVQHNTWIPTVTSHAMYVYRSCNHCCSGKGISITYSECVFCCLRYPACNASYCHLRPAPLYNIFSTLFHWQQDFRKTVTENKMCDLIFSSTFVWNIFHSKKNWARCDTKCTSVFT